MKKGATIVNAFQKFLNESNKRQNQSNGQRKSNKIWVDNGSEFYNNSFKKSLKDNDIEMYSIHNEGKSVVVERFIRTLKTKIYKYMTSNSKNVYIDKSDDIVNEYNNKYHRTIRRNQLMLKIIHILTQIKKLMTKIPNLKLVVM